MYYKVLIVDDEKRIRDGLKSIVDWNELGFELIGEACNGQEALEFIDKVECVQVILTDIRMPVMDGLVLLEKVRNRGFNTEFIILSGYDYFEYAKKAMELGAFNYILKPTKLPELKAKFLKLKEKLDEEKKKDTVLDKGMSAIKESCIKDLIYGSYSDTGQMKDKMQKAGIAIGSAGFIVVAIRLVKLNKDAAIDEVNKGIKRLINDRLESFIVTDNSDNIVCILTDNKLNNGAIMEECVEKLMTNVVDMVINSGMCCSVGIGNITSGVENACNSYKQAVAALNKRFFKGLNRCIKFSECPEKTAHIDYPSSHEKNLILFIEKGDKLKASRVIDDLFNYVLADECLDPAQVYKICLEMIAAFSRHYNSVSKRIEGVFDENKMVYRKLPDFETLEQLKEWFTDRIFLVIDIILDLKDNDSNRIVNHMKSIISRKYHEQLTLAQIANELYMNPDYLSRLFKKETGKSFIDFLTNYRIRKAKEYLKDVSCKSYEVGFRVGYRDASYFAKTFKRVTGLSITEFREGLRL